MFDIAVAIVENPFKFNEYVTPACLPPQNFAIAYGIGVISGLGLNEVSIKHCFKSKYKAVLMIFSRIHG